MRRTHVIWDFNGTVIDDVDVSFRAINILLEEYGLKKIPSVDEYRGLLCFPVIDYYRKLGFDFEKTDYKEPADRWVEIYNSLSGEITVREAALDTAKKMKTAGAVQTILSASDTAMLKEQLSSLGVSGVFDEIYGKDDVYAYGKLDLAKKWREEHPFAKAVLVGDMPHDYDAARVIGCPCVLLSGGHSTEAQRAGCEDAVLAECNDTLYETIINLLGENDSGKI